MLTVMHKSFSAESKFSHSLKDVNTMENTTIELSQWFEEETHDAAVEMMESDAVVPFGTALWP